MLYSDGSQDAPQRYRVRTFVPTSSNAQAHELQLVRHSLSSQPLRLLESGAEAAGAGARAAIEVESPDRHPGSIQAAGARPSLTTVSQPVVGLADPRQHATSEWSRQKPPKLGGAQAAPPLGHKSSFSDNNNDFNPRAVPAAPDPSTSGAALRFRAWGKSSFEAGAGSRRGAGIRRESTAGDDEATELTKLTDRRASEHGPLMDTIDIGGENEEYSEGFIQR